MTFNWIDVEKPAQRPWRGLPYNRTLNAGDLHWFPSVRTIWDRTRTGDEDALRDAMRRVYEACTA